MGKTRTMGLLGEPHKQCTYMRIGKMEAGFEPGIGPLDFAIKPLLNHLPG